MQSPSPLRIGIVGLGFGIYILEGLQKEPANRFFQVGAVCDIDPVKGAEYAALYKVPWYASLDELLADPSIDVVGLYTGPENRADLISKIIRAGKDVMTTKPFELRSAETRAVFAEARALGRTIHLNSPNPEASPWLKQVIDWQKKYDLGQPINCFADVVVNYREEADGRWLDDPARCPLAPIFRLGIYLINDLVCVMGAVDKVQAFSSRLFTKRPTVDNAQLSLLFTNGALGSIHASFCVDDGQYYANSYFIHFERGTVRRNFDVAEYGCAGRGSRLSLVYKSGEREIKEESAYLSVGSGEYDWEALYRAITEKQPLPAAYGDQVAQGVEVIEAMILTQASQLPVEVKRG